MPDNMTAAIIHHSDSATLTVSPKQTPQQKLSNALAQRKPVRYHLEATSGNSRLVQDESDPVEYAILLFETTGAAAPGTALQLIEQIRAVLPDKTDASALNAALDILSSIEPQNPMEGTLATQMVACHTMAMNFAKQAMAKGQPDKAIESHLNRSAKMMRLFSQQAETLHKLRNKGQQAIQVQHVHLDGVQQAIVGNNVGLPTPERGKG